MKKILVTGGAGYIGSILVRMLLEKGYKVRVFDRLVYGIEPIQELLANPDFELVQGDLRNLDDYPGLLDNVQGVLHLASLSNDPSCDLNPAATTKINYEAATHLAGRCKEAGIERFVFASSCSVYGTGYSETLTEISPLNPVTLYAESMVRCERFLKDIADDSFCPVMLRQATVFGLSPRMRFDLAINVMTMGAYRNKKIFVLGGGNQWRPFVHVKDTAEAFIMAMEAPADKVCGEIFNVGSNDQNYQIINLAHLVKKEIPGIHIEVAPDDADKRNYNVNFDKITNMLGFKARYKAEDGVREVVQAIKDGVLTDLDNKKYYNLKVLKALEERPATEGGEPIFFDFMPFSLPLLGKEEEEEVLDTLRSGWITTGPKTHKFEELIKEYAGCRYAVALNSCTAALFLALESLGIGDGDEVITSPVTFAATANVIIHRGAKPVFADIEPDTLNINPDEIRKKITGRTKAIMPVHMAGQPCKMDEIRSIASEHGLFVIEDAAHAIGAEYKGRRIGAGSTAACFSFYPIKNLTTIEGGILATDNEDLAEKARLMSLHGLSKGAWQRYSPSGDIHWDVLYPGYKYNMTDVQASLGIHQIKKLDNFLEKRRSYANIYKDAFFEHKELSLPSTIDGVRHAHHLFIVMLELDRVGLSRDEFVRALRAENIGTGIHFRSLHLHTYYKEAFGFKPSDFPVAADISERILSLPLYPKMSEADVKNVAGGVKKIIKYYKK